MIINLGKPAIVQGKIDENKKRGYNVRKRESETIIDVFVRSNAKIKKHIIKSFLEKIMMNMKAKEREVVARMDAKNYTQYFKNENIKKLLNSPVAYVVSVCQNFLNGKTTQEEFNSEFIEKTEKTRFIFAHMSKKDIVANQQIFKNELVFADKVYKLISKKELTKEQLIDEIKEYNKKN